MNFTRIVFFAIFLCCATFAVASEAITFCFPDRLSGFVILTEDVLLRNGDRIFLEFEGEYFVDADFGAELISLRDQSDRSSTTVLTRYDLGLEFVTTDRGCTYSKINGSIILCYDNGTLLSEATVAGDILANVYRAGTPTDNTILLLTAFNNIPVLAREFATRSDGSSYTAYAYYLNVELKPIPPNIFDPPGSCVPALELSAIPSHVKAITKSVH